MAETSGPWDGSTFAEGEWRILFAEGPDGDISQGFAGFGVDASASDRNVDIGPGNARIQGYLYESDETETFNFPVPSGSNQRIDFIALRLDPNQVTLNDRIKMVLIEGSESANPSTPALTRDPNGIWEYPLVRFGPYGSGPMAGATQIIARRLLPSLEVTSYTGDPNDQLWRFYPEPRAILITGDDSNLGKTWIGNGSSWDLWTPEPELGTLGASTGWQPDPGNAPRWRKDPSGLVTIMGGFEKTGSQILINAEGIGEDSFTLSDPLPNSIRPVSSIARFRFLADGYMRVGAGGGPPDRHIPIVVWYDQTSHRLRGSTAIGGQNTWRTAGSAVHLDGMTWWTS